MGTLTSLLTILGAVLIGAMSPGPSFLLVSRAAVAHSRGHALACSIGMGLGSALFASLALVGLVAFLEQWSWLYSTLKVVGGLYLLFVAATIIRGGHGAAEPRLEFAALPSIDRSVATGFVTQVSNPKTAVVYAGIFMAVLPEGAPAWLLISLPPLVLLVEAGWYSLVAVALSTQRSRTAYARSKRIIDRAAGIILGALGTRLLFDGIRSD